MIQTFDQGVSFQASDTKQEITFVTRCVGGESFVPSETVATVYELEPTRKPPPPLIDPPSQNFDESISIRLSCHDPVVNCSVFFTTDSTPPSIRVEYNPLNGSVSPLILTPSTLLYQQPFSLPQGMTTVRAISFVADPSFSLASDESSMTCESDLLFFSSHRQSH